MSNGTAARDLSGNGLMPDRLRLLATRLHLPSPPPKYVERPHLVQQLDEGLASGRKMTLVSAPAGFGKTTCISAWVNALGVPVTWLSLDASDDDPVRFLAYLVAALQKVDDAIGREAEGVLSLSAGQPVPVEPLIISVLNDIQTMDLNFIMVLDDVHAVKASPVLKALEVLVTNLPGNMHLVLVTREDPLLPLARLRANNQLTEIRAGDLRFSSAEAGRFLKEALGLSLSEADIATLESRTEGWVVGLQLAGLSMRGRADPSDFIAHLSGSHRYILSYLTEEVLDRQPEEIRRFLLHTSILERLCGPLCDAVTENREQRTENRPSAERDGSPISDRPLPALGSRAILEYLERANLFLVPLDDEQRWYRYHHLFADLLQAQLRQASSAEAIAGLHRRAAAWFEQHGLAGEAVNHALAAGDFDAARRLVEENTYPLMTRGELDTLLRWIEALPPEATHRRPQFLLAKAWALTFAGAAGQVETVLQQAVAMVEGEGETPLRREILGNAAAIRAFFSLMGGDEARALELAERAEALLPAIRPEAGGSSPYAFAAHSLLPFTLGMVYRGQGQYEKAAEAFGSKLYLYTAPHAVLIWTIAIMEQAVVRRLQGRLRESVEICRRAQARIAELGMRLFGALVRVDVALGDVLREQNQLEEAYRLVTGALERIQTWDMPTDRLSYLLSLVRIQESQGDLSGASETLRAARDLKAAHPVFHDLSRTVDLYEVRLALAAQDIVRAARLLDDLGPGTSRAVPLREQELILLARLRLAQGRPGDAVAVVSDPAREAEAAGRMYTWLEMAALQACALDRQGRRKEALALLVKALQAAEPEGFVRVFVELGEAMRLLISDCDAALQRRLEIVKRDDRRLLEYIDGLLDAFHRDAPSRKLYPIRNQQSKINNLVESLTPRELEVLQLIAAGDSNRTIAEKLVITVSAVKKHTANIYGKLDVSSRTQAVARARQLGLLQVEEETGG